MNTARNGSISEYGFNANPPERQDDCAEHGEFTARNLFGTMWTKCPKCAEVARLKSEEAQREKERQLEIDRWEARLGGAGIPERFRGRTLDTYRADSEGQRAALKFAQDYAENFADNAESGKSALFIGKPGTGKTHLAVGIGLAAMGQRYAVMFTTAMRALRLGCFTRSTDPDAKSSARAIPPPSPAAARSSMAGSSPCPSPKSAPCAS